MCAISGIFHYALEASVASDTEVVLQAYAAYGPDCVSHLNGQFAFAIWDARQ
ncbi:MAG: hypothetical protein ACRERE_12545 [Candidatus Entotheonellia bacterium]